MTEAQLLGQLNEQFAGLDEEVKEWGPGQLIDWVIDNVGDLVDFVDLDEETLELVVDTVERFYDSVIRPIDLPYIPNLVENRVDDAIWGAIEYLLRQYLA